MGQLKILPVAVMLCTTFNAVFMAENYPCHQGWTYHNPTLSCMKFFDKWYSFNGASNECSRRTAGHLVYIFKKETDNFVKGLLQEANRQEAFIGLHDRAKSGEYKWGKADYKGSSSYWGWKDQEPNPDKDKHHVITTKEGWEKKDTKENSYFICQIDAELPKPQLTCPVQEEGQESSGIVCTIPDLDPSYLSDAEIKQTQTAVVSCDRQHDCRPTYAYDEAAITSQTPGQSIKLPITIQSVAIHHEGNWTCSYTFRNSPDDVTSQCYLKVYAMPEKPTCHPTFTSDGIEVNCTVNKIYPRGNCQWSYFVEDEMVKNYLSAQESLQNESNTPDKPYYKTTCKATVRVSSFGVHSFKVSMYPDVEGGSNYAKTAWANVSVVQPEEPDIFVLEGLGYKHVTEIGVEGGQDVNITCKVNGGSLPVQSATITCDSPIQDTDEKSTVKRFGKSVTMFIPASKDVDGKSCHCTGSLIANLPTKQANVIFSVKYPAQVQKFSIIQEEPMSGMPTTFKCEADGNPTPDIGLYCVRSDNTQVLLEKAHWRTLTHTQTVTGNMTGQYVCVANNTANLFHKQSKTLKVKCPPEYCEGMPENPSFGVPVNEDVKFRIKCVLAYPEPVRFSLWRGYSKVLVDNTSATFRYTDAAKSQGEITVTIKDLKEEMLGEYRLSCGAAGTEIHGYLNFTLTAQGPPVCPEALNVSAVYRDAITLYWTPGFDGGLTQTFTVLQHDISKLTPDSDSPYNVGSVEDSKEETMAYNITGLSADTAYRFSLSVRNSEGETNCTQLRFNATPKAFPSTKNDEKLSVIIPVIFVVMIIFAAATVFFIMRRRSAPSKTVKPDVQVVTSAKNASQKDATEKKLSGEATYAQVIKAKDKKAVKMDKSGKRALKTEEKLEEHAEDATYAQVMKKKGKKGPKNDKTSTKKATTNQTGKTVIEGDVYAQVLKKKNTKVNKALAEENVYNNEGSRTKDAMTYSNTTAIQEQNAENVYSNQQATNSSVSDNSAGNRSKSDKQSGRTVNEDGLIYVTVEINPKTTNPEIVKAKKKLPKTKKAEHEPVEYVSIDYTKQDQEKPSDLK